MGKKDIITNNYIKANHIFADIFNYLIYQGHCIITPDNLHPADTTELGIPYIEKGSMFPVQRYRDELKSFAVMKDNSSIYLLLGIENQSDIHYAMPVKSMVYDALQYTSQVEKTAQKHRRKNEPNGTKDEKKTTTGEYLTGFYKEDRLLPVITLVIYWGTEAWDAPMNLHSMFSSKKAEILSLIPDYQINLIAPAFMDDIELNKFQTSLREVFYFIKYSKNKQKLEEVIKNNVRYQNLEKSAAMVINTLTNAKLQFNEKEEMIDMCKAIEDMRLEAIQAGRAEGLAKGRSEGLAEGRSEGLAEGRSEGLAEGRMEANLSSVKNLVEKLGFSIKQSMEILNIPLCDYDYYQEKLCDSV